MDAPTRGLAIADATPLAHAYAHVVAAHVGARALSIKGRLDDPQPREIDGSRDRPAIVAAVASAYGVHSTDVEPDVASFLDELERRGLIATVEFSVTSSGLPSGHTRPGVITP